ncbi:MULTISPECIES: succinate dehydrogenase, hydrophobic membrane anchor protein [Shewanella]|uniref:Succinate dehydrogenase hydrophobic membrane anchor subunit n=1 Tax=Shewanella indica TaxID=768528 RepID=A0ABU4QDA4_9GAMM|nr:MULTISPECIES: succinate dehydrogenase, hydrophobic membrane anchor protein [Shewanella]OIN04455.1 succinate dehydrogenase, hydrophobic membrane anchor protein [Shewanella algae]MCE9786440.1 succinate dehydrogenase, hydrophobic membrane anchor protein [Shewanella chilikensis]MDX6017364.1 succinate dehydrogenase, hydrophobic membrane anchor protein [Shewanella indica]NDO76181.1 succinate dehydrogenase, hydrophobic membrane anchor protein [Shewanella sp. SE1]TVP09618.1 succinate dehydrogenase 
MVTNAASFGRSGVHDFILLRASAVILAVYTIFLVGFAACSSPLTYDVWHGLFASLPMKVFTLLALIALLIHAWIGIWQVLTDYVKNVALRGVLQFVFVVTAFTYLASGIVIVWGV